MLPWFEWIEKVSKKNDYALYDQNVLDSVSEIHVDMTMIWRFHKLMCMWHDIYVVTMWLVFDYVMLVDCDCGMESHGSAPHGERYTWNHKGGVYKWRGKGGCGGVAGHDP